MEMIKQLIRQSWQLMLLATLTGMISGFSGASLVKTIGDGVTAHHASAELAWRFFGLCTVFLITKLISEFVLMHLTQDAVHRIRVDLSRKLIATPVKKLQALGQSELLAIMTNDIGTLVQALQMLPPAFGNIIIVIGCMGYLTWLSWQLSVVTVACLTIGLVAYQFAERIPLRHMFKLREQMDFLYRNFRSLIEGSRELQLNTKRGKRFVEGIMAPDSLAFKNLYLLTMKIYALISNLNNILFYLLIGVLVFIVPIWFTPKAEVLTTFTLVLLFLMRPINDILYAVPVIRQAGFSLAKIGQLEGALGEPEALSNTAAATTAFPAVAQRSLVLKKVAHHYPGPVEERQFMLGPIDLSIGEGEIVFIIGGNGSGKTTLAMLLLGLYAPEAGEIHLNGTLVTPENITQYRQHFSAVFADFHLFEQLLDADEDGVRERAMHYVEKLGMAHKVSVVDGKFSTINLSTGQRKRLALVSAYLEDRPIYLFDEWAADQDPVFKRVFYTELLPDLKRRGKTVLVITHDDAYFTCADRVIKLEEGHLQHQEQQPAYSVV
ncbi:cyclic peptide export ABC transporter [Andreprevotia chitinilytica]|uniref:cyclic peptide export ABC transporter n=1 Tax=Andreprevotia chitinilytica TaxID=396808 RepID=UPI000553F4D8|nr:cyclic peptide export ABC transporter [Andreprevotia chitinilytica]